MERPTGRHHRPDDPLGVGVAEPHEQPATVGVMESAATLRADRLGSWRVAVDEDPGEEIAVVEFGLTVMPVS